MLPRKQRNISGACTGYVSSFVYLPAVVFLGPPATGFHDASPALLHTTRLGNVGVHGAEVELATCSGLGVEGWLWARYG